MLRRKNAEAVRKNAAELAANRPHPQHKANGDEQKFRHDDLSAKSKAKAGDPSYLMSYTKGLPHDYETGLIQNPADFQQFVKGIDSGHSRDFRETPLGVPQNCNGTQCSVEELNWRSTKALLGKTKAELARMEASRQDIINLQNTINVHLSELNLGNVGISNNNNGNTLTQTVTQLELSLSYIPSLDNKQSQTHQDAVMRANKELMAFKKEFDSIKMLIKGGKSAKGITEVSKMTNELSKILIDLQLKPVSVRAWESAGAGNTFDLEGPDAQAVTMVPAPQLGSDELSAEMAEVYAQALLRDIPFSTFSPSYLNSQIASLHINNDKLQNVEEVVQLLNQFTWFKGGKIDGLNEDERFRRRTNLTPSNAFRGIAPGDDIGPYISQFLLAGNNGINANDPERSSATGLISYGAISVDQKVRVADQKDYMTEWDDYYDAQNGADLRGLESYSENTQRRFIHTPRDIATYVHYDALYEAYLNACLMLLGMGTKFDPGIPFQQADNVDHQQGFAHFGGPHILSLVTEVATRALKAVRFQKFNNHRRLRPEALAARIHKIDLLAASAPELHKMYQDLNDSCVNSKSILDKINDHNQNMNGNNTDSYLLPMAFCEGSPMHPAYGAGHATVAGACVTILKAFFDHSAPLAIVDRNEINDKTNRVAATCSQDSICQTYDPTDEIPAQHFAYVSVDNGTKLSAIPVLNQNGELSCLTVEGELNKLAANISIGRNWAGVHYFTDYIESLKMGEQIALSLLEEQKLTYSENFSMTVPLFDGSSVRI